MAWGSIKSDNWTGYGWVLLWLWFLIHPTDSLSLNASERSKSWTGKKLRFDVFSIRDCMAWGKTCPNTVRFNIIVVFYMSWTSSLALTMLVVNATGAANAAVADGFSQFHPIPHGTVDHRANVKHPLVKFILLSKEWINSNFCNRQHWISYRVPAWL